ncbi:restriction endonuclease [Archangium sp.]|uniref:restriction endonuclease n=1 Tax=Archangium sp. TaxID=1872627 RepID=UPI00286D141C|nr:restriction endonuclease [Archangium sp.]
MNKSRATSPPWRVYERLVALLQSDKASDEITVVPNAHLIGAITGIKRQVDVLIDARVAEDVSRRVIVDAKFRKRKIDVKDVEAFEGMMKDCRAQRGIIVCANGFTQAAHRRAQRSITISLVPAETVESLDIESWYPCLGKCAMEARGRTAGWVLYDRPLGLTQQNSPLTVLAVGKCDGCNDFHVWCWDCGAHFALRGEEADHTCSCNLFWLTERVDEGFDECGNLLESIRLLLVVPVDAIPLVPEAVAVTPLLFAPVEIDRRPLN